jgi:hypothetical protein
MNAIAQITLRDGLGFPSGFTAPADYTCVIFCRVPPDWLEGDKLRAAKLEAVFEKLYGAQWRLGNSDGSQYVVLSVEARILSAAEEQTAAWRALSNNREYRYWFYDATAPEGLRSVAAAQL